jgi:hypothetical protein
MLIHHQNLYVSLSKQRTGHREAQSHGLSPHTKNLPYISIPVLFVETILKKGKGKLRGGIEKFLDCYCCNCLGERT